MADSDPENEPTIVERWLEDQQQWQRTMLAYLDSMTKNDDFLVHLGNAMRGSLLAGKPYPTAPPAGTAPAGPAAPAPDAPPDDRLDKVLYALHQLEGEVRDLQMAMDDIRKGRPRSAAAKLPAARKKKTAARKKKKPAPKSAVRKSTGAKTRKPKGRA